MVELCGREIAMIMLLDDAEHILGGYKGYEFRLGMLYIFGEKEEHIFPLIHIRCVVVRET